jgi:hypothetical protein
MSTGAATGLSSPRVAPLRSILRSPSFRSGVKPHLENAAKTVAWALGPPETNNAAPAPRRNIDNWVNHRLQQHFRRIERHLDRLDYADTPELQALTKTLAERLRVDHRRHRSSSPAALRVLKEGFTFWIHALWAAATDGDMCHYRRLVRMFRSELCPARPRRTRPLATSTDRFLALVAKQMTQLGKAAIPNENLRDPSPRPLPLQQWHRDLSTAATAMGCTLTDAQKRRAAAWLASAERAADAEDRREYLKALESMSDAVELFNVATMAAED